MLLCFITCYYTSSLSFLLLENLHPALTAPHGRSDLAAALAAPAAAEAGAKRDQMVAARGVTATVTGIRKGIRACRRLVIQLGEGLTMSSGRF